MAMTTSPRRDLSWPDANTIVLNRADGHNHREASRILVRALESLTTSQQDHRGVNSFAVRVHVIVTNTRGRDNHNLIEKSPKMDELLNMFSREVVHCKGRRSILDFLEPRGLIYIFFIEA
jgi:hypothetical protein